MEGLKQIMGKGILVAAVVLSGLFASHTVYATDIYVYIHNTSPEPITVQLIEDNCWHRKAFASPVAIDPGQLKCMKTEESESGITCVFRSNYDKWMKFTIFSATKSHGDFTIKFGNYGWFIETTNYGRINPTNDSVDFNITIK
jgi:hypothetical protein